MKLELIKPIKALNKAYLKGKVSRDHIELFKNNLQQLLGRINEQESEEHLKNVIADFLKDTWYKEQFEINTKDRNDLVIHTGKTTKEPVGVILEVKKPSNKSEMMTEAKPNAKALQELILYYLRERFDHSNTDIKYLVVTNIYEWYIIDEVWFEKNVFRNNKLKRDYENWKLSGKDTKFFYDSIAKAFLDEVTEEMPAAYFDVRDYQKYVANADKEDDTKLIGLYKILSPAHLLKQPFINDSNSLDTKFYTELLHIIGLEEIKDGGKKLIKRKAKSDEASLLENTIIKLEDKDALRNINSLSTFGANKEEQLFNVALELCITWINRVLFIKLLEAQLYKYHKGNKDYLFLNSTLVYDFDELSNLFFQVLAEKPGTRRNHIQEKFNKVPYLNSSLFERIELERQTINVSELDNRLQLPLSGSTVLKDDKGKRKTGSLPTLQYLFEFLDAYDFTSEGGEEIQEENKNLINASVLGLIFEKINGYKDGSFFTPGFVTMYMCKETIRRSVLQKFNEAKGWQCETLDSLYNKIDDKKEANKIINNLHICDPAVGSGHFLVSALNEIIAIKSELKILQDSTGKSLRDYHVEVVNDEFIVTDEDGKLFNYNPHNKESQRIQETLFHEKETIIENCLFGVDINPNSVKICRLRLWIELLKNAYYTTSSNYLELETLPNIDINIKCGNSLVSRFALDADIKTALRNTKKWSIDSYKVAVQTYRDAESKEQKREMEELIDSIKKDFTSYISPNDPKYKKLSKLRGDLFNLSQTKELFDEGNKKSKDSKKKIEQLSTEITKLETEIGEIKNNKIYENAFEWRFEFPEVLNDAGDFVGFDVVIGNPPYGVKFDAATFDYLKSNYLSLGKSKDSYVVFIELANLISKKMGFASYIVPTGWYTGTSFGELRKYFAKNTNPVLMTNLPYDVFESAWVDTSIFVTQKAVKSWDWPRSDSHELTVKLFDKKEKIASVKSFYHAISTIVFSQWFREDRDQYLLLKNDLVVKLINKIKQLSQPLCNYADIQRGVTPFHLTTEPVHENSKIGFNGSVRRYKLETGATMYVRYDNSLAEFKPEKYFQGERILLRELISRKFELQATKTSEYFISNKSMQSIIANSDLHCNYLLGILNSNLMSWYFLNISQIAQRDDFPKIVLKETRQLPVFPIDFANSKHRSVYKRINELVDTIVSARKKDMEANINLWEIEIDSLIYKLYDFTEEEIRIIENKNLSN